VFLFIFIRLKRAFEAHWSMEVTRVRFLITAGGYRIASAAAKIADYLAPKSKVFKGIVRFIAT